MGADGKAGAAGGKTGDAENLVPLNEQLLVLRNKVLRRDLRIEQLTKSEKHLRAAAATVGSSAAQIRAQVKHETEKLRRERDALQIENRLLRNRQLDQTLVA